LESRTRRGELRQPDAPVPLLRSTAVPSVDIVVVSYNSRDELRACVEPLTSLPDVRVFVVDNASSDESLEAVADLPLTRVQLDRNGGFAHGCNVGWRAGNGEYVLFLNPDASLTPNALARLAAVLDDGSEVGAVGPRLIGLDGRLNYSLRRFPRLRSTFAQALFVHRLFPQAPWTDEVVREDAAYQRRAAAEWISGACILTRRSALVALDGLDEGFFMYCEDTDFCARLWAHGLEVRYEPEAVVVHEGGASAPRPSLLPVLAASRVRYARKHRGSVGALLERAGVALGSLTHALVSPKGADTRAGHVRALARALRD
jgi:N-acetylglucosaminyl-diphospho-decaprenol L-rhamnosyltransferase